MRAIRLLIEYDGSDFVGWQVQAHGRTVQGELASALGILLRENIVRWLGTHRRWNARTWTSSPFPHAFVDDDRAHTPRPQRNPTQRYLHTRCRRGRTRFSRAL